MSYNKEIKVRLMRFLLLNLSAVEARWRMHKCQIANYTLISCRIASKLKTRDMKLKILLAIYLPD